MNATPAQAKEAVLKTVFAVSDAIRDLGEVPSGQLYAQVMGHMSLASYQSVIGILKQAGVVEEKNHLLRWIGPKPAAK